MLVQAISPFPTMFSKGFFPGPSKDVIVWESVNDNCWYFMHCEDALYPVLSENCSFFLLNIVGYEIVNLDRIPDRGPAMLIYYHGTIPIDFYYVMAKCLLEKQRQIHAVGDNFLFSVPGMNSMNSIFLSLSNLYLSLYII